MRNLCWVWAAICFCALTCFAGPQQSALNPAGPQSGKIALLWWFFFWLLASVFVIVIAVMLSTLTRTHRGGSSESRVNAVIATATGVTIITLFVLLIASVSTGKATADLGQKGNLLKIEVTGNQWWWQFRYVNDDPSQVLTTANEIHIPVGRAVLITGMSNDVIHSFWAPNLHGKRDLIPSRVTTEYIQADKPGVYRGQCAEFCGLQHAHMSFYVIAEPEDKFNAWIQAQLQPAETPSNSELTAGQQAFLKYECVFCHQIRGTTAAGQNAPDLTHFGSRRSIAAGTLPNTVQNVSDWIVRPQAIKPGNHMATLPVASNDLHPLAEYLESLK